MHIPRMIKYAVYRPDLATGPGVMVFGVTVDATNQRNAEAAGAVYLACSPADLWAVECSSVAMPYRVVRCDDDPV